jgi:hypothetical protein
MVFMWKTSPVKTIADALKTESTLSGTGVGSTVSIYPTALNNVIGTKFKLVMATRARTRRCLRSSAARSKAIPRRGRR